MKEETMKRRVFLKAGIAAASSGLIFSRTLSASDKPVSRLSESIDEFPLDRESKILLKYSGEFGNIKPEIRRINHGGI